MTRDSVGGQRRTKLTHENAKITRYADLGRDAKKVRLGGNLDFVAMFLRLCRDF